jgi:hypothetical protein
MKFLSAALTLLLIGISAHAETWTMEKLVGIAPEFDGPSCYTAALLAKGYVDTLSFVGSKEIEFFMDRFCEEKTGSPEPGNLITLTPHVFLEPRPHIDHVATYLGDGNVFEKEGGIGKFKPYQVQDPHFLIRPMMDSPWFKDYVSKGYDLKIFKCQDAKTVRAKNATCEARVNSLGLADLRRDFERLLLAQPAKFDPSAEDVPVIRSLAQELAALNLNDPCYDYVVAMGEMLIGTFKSIRVKHMEAMSNDWKNARSELEKVMASKSQVY